MLRKIMPIFNFIMVQFHCTMLVPTLSNIESYTRTSEFVVVL